MSKVTTFWLRDLAWVYGAKRVKDHYLKSDITWIGTCYVGESGGELCIASNWHPEVTQWYCTRMGWRHSSGIRSQPSQ
ncbi:unnamed protein product [Arctogadus glacialis]